MTFLKKAIFFVFILAFLHSALIHAEIYKFQDHNGNWHFSDTKPLHSKTPIEQLKHNPKVESTSKKPHLETKQANGQLHYIAHNPLLISVQFFLRDSQTKKKISMKVLSPSSSETLFKQQNSTLKRDIAFNYVIGDPDTKPPSQLILPPFTDYKPMRISQSFNGQFSHNRRSNRYAVDIGMPAGTKITAVKAGIVVYTKDDYAYAGVTSAFFFDKANVVEILHDDGTYAIYGHLLLGGVHVKVGDRITSGQIIGLSGNTGYSTGPHLHFVIRYNDNGRTNSLPFKFMQPNNMQITPQQGEWLLPFLPN